MTESTNETTSASHNRQALGTPQCVKSESVRRVVDVEATIRARVLVKSTVDRYRLGSARSFCRMAAPLLPCSARNRTRRRPTEVSAVSVPAASAAATKQTTKTMTSIHSWAFMTAGLSEELADAPVLVYPDDRLGEQRCYRKDRQRRIRTELVGRDGHGVGDDHLFDIGPLQPLHRVAGEDWVGGRDENSPGPLPAQGLRQLGDGAAGGDDVFDDDAVAVLHVSRDCDHLHLVVARASLVAERDRGTQLVGDRLGPPAAARVGRDDREVLQVERVQVVGDDPVRREVVRRHVEESLDGLGVEVEQQQPVGAGQRDEVGDQLRGDRLTRLGLAFLAGVAVVRDDRGDSPGRGPAKRVEDDEELHQVLVHRRRRRLDDEHVVAAHRVLDLDVDLAVGEAAQARVGELDVEDLGDAGGQFGVRAAGDELERPPRRGLLPGELDCAGQPTDHSVCSPPLSLTLSLSERGEFFLRITLAGTPTAVAPSGTSFVTTEPAPVRAPLPSLTGATSIVSTPTKAPSPISVRFLRWPSKLAVIVPAPMLASSPTSVSPR